MPEHKITDLGAAISLIFSCGLGILLGTLGHDARIGFGVIMVTLGVLYGITRLWWYLDDNG
jgi:hypothetical protein